jgi:hypothetical protein
MACPTLKPSELKEVVNICVKARRRFMIHGDPGIGKSQVVEQVADGLFAELYGFSIDKEGRVHDKGGKYLASNRKPYFRDVRAATLDPVDLRGLPMVKDGQTSWAAPDFLVLDQRGGIFFMDEINRGTEMVANACFSLCDKGELGSVKMPETWVIGSAVNDKDTGARKMSSALSARFEHFDAQTNLEDVCKIAVARCWHPSVIAFLRMRPDLLHKYNPVERVSPNPRGWEFVSDIMHQDPPLRLLKALICGAVGEGAAIEFVAFTQLWMQLPNIDQIIMDPKGSPVSTDPSVLYVVTAALARRATPKNIGRILQYLERVPVEFNVASVISALRRDPSMAVCAEFTNWCIAHADVTVA